MPDSNDAYRSIPGGGVGWAVCSVCAAVRSGGGAAVRDPPYLRSGSKSKAATTRAAATPKPM
ncbi:MAG: hypothetical protein AMXMBFR4_09900 [Candidatus Hydrogenedentota bacterium]